MVFSQKLSKDTSIRPDKDSLTGPSKASSFSRNELKMRGSKQYVTSEKTNNKIMSHIRRAKNRSIHFIKSNYSEGSGIMTPKINLSQKKITAQIYDKSKKIKTHDRSKTGLGGLDKKVFMFDKFNSRSSRGHKEMSSLKNTSIVEKEPVSLRQSEKKKEEDVGNVFRDPQVVEESREESEELPIQKKELRTEMEQSND
jgi:hypothetical protein